MNNYISNNYQKILNNCQLPLDIEYKNNELSINSELFIYEDSFNGELNINLDIRPIMNSKDNICCKDLFGEELCCVLYLSKVCMSIQKLKNSNNINIKLGKKGKTVVSRLNINYYCEDIDNEFTETMLKRNNNIHSNMQFIWACESLSYQMEHTNKSYSLTVSGLIINNKLLSKIKEELTEPINNLDEIVFEDCIFESDKNYNIFEKNIRIYYKNCDGKLIM